MKKALENKQITQFTQIMPFKIMKYRKVDFEKRK